MKILRYLNNLSLPIFVAISFLFLYLPIFILVFASFQNTANISIFSLNKFSLKWYYELFNSPEIWRAFWVSGLVGLSSTTLGLFISLSLVYYNLMARSFENLSYVFYANVIIPEIVLSVGLLTFLTYLNINLSIFTLIIAHTVLTLGYIVPIIYSRYLSIDRNIIEASLDLGATLTQTFFRVILPYLLPSILAAGLLAFILSFDDFVLSFFLSGGQAQTLSLFVYSLIRSGTSPIINALSTVMLIISSFLVLLFCFLNVKTKIF